MRTCTAYVLGLALLLAGCSNDGNAPADRREFKLQGQIISVAPERQEFVIKHEDIPGFMSAMTMPYKVKEAKELASLAPGDLVNARLIVETSAAYVEGINKVGTAPLERPAGSPAAGMNILPAGAPVPPVDLIDQDGHHVSLDTLRGSAVVVSFTYIGCPMPDQCPLVDKRFAETQARLAAEQNALRVRLLTVTIDPTRDTTTALKSYAERMKADPRIWTMATGEQKAIDEWASRFGVSVSRAANNPSDITHNLRTVIIDRQGNLVQTYSGTDWTPSQLLADVKVMVGVD
jgi:protein SCO1